MKVINKEMKAAIFDLDGTLLDSTGIWKNIDINFFHSRGMEVPPKYSYEIAHIGLKEAAILTKNKYGVKESIEEIMQEWNNACKNLYLYEVPLKAHVIEYLTKLKENGIKLAVATANSKENYEPCLKRLGIYDFFDFIADVDEVKAGKNDVKLYNYVANKLHENPENIAIFEDNSVGLKTAYENGFISVAVYDKAAEKYDEEKHKYSHIYIKDFKELL